ncbi:MAG: EscN/YscN/HrcN family type III secretion system ATPase, partial [bacterium]
MALYREVEDLVQIGAYAKGSNPETDVAITFHGQIDELLRQDLSKGEGFEDAKKKMLALAMKISSTPALGRK